MTTDEEARETAVVDPATNAPLLQDDQASSQSRALHQHKMGVLGHHKNMAINSNTESKDSPCGSFFLDKQMVLVIVFFVWAISGIALFRCMGFRWVDVLYMMVQIVTTVGYGDLVPETQWEKLGTAMVVLSSTLLIANIIMYAIDAMIDSQTAKMESAIVEKEDSIRKDIQEKAEREAHSKLTEGQRSMTLKSLGQAEANEKRSKMIKKVSIDFGIFTLCLLVGTVFFAMFEPCTCSYGKTRIENCVEERCAEPRPDEAIGYQKTWVDAFYMSVITMTTVGFGDYTAESEGGRLFGAVWMLLGVTATINFIGTFSDGVFTLQDDIMRSKITHAAFHENDDDGDGMLDKTEFLKMQLIQNGLATKEQFDSIMRQFDIIAGQDEKISKNEFAAYYLPGEFQPDQGEQKA